MNSLSDFRRNAEGRIVIGDAPVSEPFVDWPLPDSAITLYASEFYGAERRKVRDALEGIYEVEPSLPKLEGLCWMCWWAGGRYQPLDKNSSCFRCGRHYDDRSYLPNYVRAWKEREEIRKKFRARFRAENNH